MESTNHLGNLNKKRENSEKWQGKLSNKLLCSLFLIFKVWKERSQEVDSDTFKCILTVPVTSFFWSVLCRTSLPQNRGTGGGCLSDTELAVLIGTILMSWGVKLFFFSNSEFRCWHLLEVLSHRFLSAGFCSLKLFIIIHLMKKIQVKHVLQDYINSVFLIQFSLLITFAHFLSDRSTFWWVTSDFMKVWEQSYDLIPGDFKYSE